MLFDYVRNRQNKTSYSNHRNIRGFHSPSQAFCLQHYKRKPGVMPRKSHATFQPQLSVSQMVVLQQAVCKIHQQCQ